MNFDKKSLIEYDYKVYTEQYKKIKNDLSSINHRNDEDLTKENLKNWLDSGLFTRRLKFRKHKENFYITTANIKRGKGQEQEIRFGEDYLYSYWDKQKVEGFLSRTIDDHFVDDRLAELDLIGEYHPKNKNLLNVKYQTKSGKEFIKNAKNFINGIDDNDIVEKIDIDSFFRLNFELAGQGIQAKALYEENNCIIEGMAGTGKSTIALQKLKYFYEKHNVEQNKMLVVVKNFKLKSHFLTLLEDKNINLEKIKILSLNEIYKDKITIKDFINLKNISSKLIQEVDKYINSRDVKSLSNHYYQLFNYIGIDFFKNLLTKKIELLQSSENLIKLRKFNNELEELNKIKILNDKEKERKKNIIKDINKISPFRFEKILKSIDSKYQFSLTVIDELISLIDFSDISLSNCLTLKWIIEYKNFQINLSKLEQKKKDLILARDNKSNHKISDIDNELSKIEEQLKRNFPFATREYLTKFKDTIIKVYLNQNYISKTLLMDYAERDKNLIYKYLNLVNREYEIIIVDEAQDFEKDEIEFLRLLSNKIFLTGDMLQNLNQSRGLNNWNEILFKDEIFENNSELNIFNLKHNYRQTYQLANASFNFRNILLQRELEDIGDDYFENEKRFGETEYFKPMISFFKNDEQIYDMVNDTLKNLLNTYTSRFPLVIVANDFEKKDYYLNLFKDFNLNDPIEFLNSDILIYTIDEIKGEEFPIVFADISKFNSKEIYLIMSRAQFELKLYFQDYDNFNKSFFDLITNKLNLIEINKTVNLNQININEIKNEELKSSISKDEDKIEYDVEENKELTIEPKIIIESLDDDNTIDENNENAFNLEQAINKHNKSVEDDKRELELSIIKEQEKYLNKIKEQFEKNYKNSSKMKKYIVNVNVKTGYKETKDFLLKQYNGYCQICGFTFKKEKDQQNYFQHFNWFSNKISKQEVNFINAGSSLCLCSKCHSVAKYGSFESKFLENMRKIDFNSKNITFDRFCEAVNEKTINIDIPECYDFIEMDMYKIPIKMLGNEYYIFYTEEHFLHFYNILTLK